MVRFKYRGEDDALKDCELADISMDHNRIFPFQGTAFKPAPVQRSRKSIFGVPVCKVYYISWVGLLNDWVMVKERPVNFSTVAFF